LVGLLLGGVFLGWGVGGLWVGVFGGFGVFGVGVLLVGLGLVGGFGGCFGGGGVWWGGGGGVWCLDYFSLLHKADIDSKEPNPLLEKEEKLK